MIRRRIRMLETRQGHNGLGAFKYERGQSYWMPSSLATQYMEQGIACEDKAIEVPETKVIKKKKIFKK